MIEQAALITALLDRAVNMSLGLKVVLPREVFKPAHNQIYLEVQWLPNETLELYVGKDAPAWYRGLLQITVCTPAETSIIDASVVADEVISFWEKGDVIDAGDFSIKITRRPWPAPSLKDGDWDRLPITIDYRVTA